MRTSKRTKSRENAYKIYYWPTNFNKLKMFDRYVLISQSFFKLYLLQGCIPPGQRALVPHAFCLPSWLRGSHISLARVSKTRLATGQLDKLIRFQWTYSINSTKRKYTLYFAKDVALLKLKTVLLRNFLKIKSVSVQMSRWTLIINT